MNYGFWWLDYIESFDGAVSVYDLEDAAEIYANKFKLHPKCLIMH